MIMVLCYEEGGFMEIGGGNQVWYMSGSWYSKEVVGSVEIYKEGVEGFFEVC